MDNEIRSAGAELRAEDEGVFEGYIVTWNTVDSYNSTFRRGAFKKTLEERADKVKVLWNHEQGTVIGIPEEIREDETGVFVRGRLITSVQKAADTYELMKAGAINTLSFGFRAVKQRFEKGVRVITEVMLAEISPVVFEANETAVVTDVRSEDYNETLRQREMYQRRYMLIESLLETMDDIWWTVSPDNLGEAGDKFDAAVVAFADAHRSWFQEFTDYFGGDESRQIDLALAVESPLASAVVRYLRQEGITAEELSQRSALTVEEVESLRAGKPIADYQKLGDVSSDIADAHQQVRSTAVESLCNELRDGINPAESTRITALLQRSLPLGADAEEPPEEDFSGVLEHLNKFRNGLT